MKKNFVVFILISIMSFSMIACGNNNDTSEPQNTEVTDTKKEIPDDNPEEPDETLESVEEQTKESDVPAQTQNTYTIDGITITANNFSVEPYEDKNGEYTKKISIMFNIKNDTDKAFGYSKMWEGKLSDGYKLKSWTDIRDLELKQVPSNGSIDDVAYLLANDSVNLTEVVATYPFIDYDEEYWDDLGKIMTGEMNQEEYMSKYSNYEELSFNLTPIQ